MNVAVNNCERGQVGSGQGGCKRNESVETIHIFIDFSYRFITCQSSLEKISIIDQAIMIQICIKCLGIFHDDIE